MPALALYQPEIAANVGAAIRVAACFGAPLHVIEPCGFPWRVRDIDRVAMDYSPLARPTRHAQWDTFRKAEPGRLVLLTTKATTTIWDHPWASDDIILIGQESAGVPDDIHNGADCRVTIPMAPGARSLNMAVAGAVALGEAQRQLMASVPAR